MHKIPNHQARFVPKLLPAWPEVEGCAKPAMPAASARQSQDVFASGSGGCVQLYLREVGRVEALSQQEETRLILQVKDGNQAARERLIRASLRRVVEISRDFQDMGLPLLDLISEGNVGLLKAIDRFEPGNGTSFAAISTWWIRQAIKRALTTGRKPLFRESWRSGIRSPIAE